MKRDERIELVTRRATAADAVRLAAVGQATFLQSYAGEIAADDLMAHSAKQHAQAVYEAWLGNPEYRLWLVEAVNGAAPVGYAVCGPPDLPLSDLRSDDIELKRFYLLHRFHGQGVGWTLMNNVLNALYGALYGRALLGVYGRNEPALEFYRKIGFLVVGERRFQVGAATYDDMILALDLARWKAAQNLL